jgi:ABC-type dipeptide/oligopeptide/nickel transport system ATPase subunit
MTPQEKAKELIRQFYSVGAVECKQCALIAVDEIISVIDPETQIKTWLYFKQVKEELKKL